MKIAVVTPADLKAKNGNRNTAVRWARLLRQCGHRVSVMRAWDRKPYDSMLALHARRSADSIQQFAEIFPERALIVALTGTDLYRDIRFDAEAQRSMQLATRMIVLQEKGLDELREDLRRKTRVVYQSARAVKAPTRNPRKFEVAVIGHLREEKDPFCTARALEKVNGNSNIRVTHLGRALDDALAAEALRRMGDARYRWLGERSHYRTRMHLARSHLLVVSSLMEGGANVISEALAANTPVIASDIPGNVGMLGAGYAGYYPVGDAKALAELLERAEIDRTFYDKLVRQCGARAFLVSEAHERAALCAAIQD